jgi:large conductance mechanosensitive channel
MGLLKEFKDFAMRGNVIDLAVGVVIGAAFGKIVDSLVKNVIMPAINMLTGGAKLNATPVKEGELNLFAFLQTIIDFLIIAAAIFLVIKLINTAKARFETQQAAAPPPPPEDVVLLREIRDLLKR